MEAVREEEGDDSEGDSEDEEEEEEEEGKEPQESQSEIDKDGGVRNEEEISRGRKPVSEDGETTPSNPHNPTDSFMDDAVADVAGQLSNLVIPDEPNRDLSRSPPHSRRTSPQNSDTESEEGDNIKAKAASELVRKRAQQQRKYHSKRSVRQAGRAKGHKAKQNNQVSRDKFWE